MKTSELKDIFSHSTLGITVVSAVALSLKAHQYHQAEQAAYQWLATDSLPPFAVQSLRELLLDIWQQQRLPASIALAA